MNPKAKAAVAVIGVLVTGAAIHHGLRAHRRDRASQEACTAWARLERCLVGAEPLGNESPSERLRKIALGIQARSTSETPDPADAQWPGRCEPYALALQHAWLADLGARGQPDDSDFRGPTKAGDVAVVLHDGGLTLDHYARWSPAIDWLWEARGELGGKSGPMDDVPLPPAPATPIRLSQPSLPIRPDTSLFEAVAAQTLRILSEPPRQFCAFAGLNGPEQSVVARCLPISAAVPADDRRGTTTRLIGLEEGAPALLAVRPDPGPDAATRGVYSVASGEMFLAADDVFGNAYGLADGAIAALDDLERDKDGKPVLDTAQPPSAKLSNTTTLARRLPDGSLSRTPLDRPSPSPKTSDVTLIAGHILWLEEHDGDKEVFAREVRWDEAAVGPVQDIGKLPSRVTAPKRVGAIGYSACRTSEALFVDVALHELSDDELSANHAVLVFSGGRWTAPLEPEAAGGRASCEGRTLTYTWLRSGAASDGESGPVFVMQTRCTPEGCSTAKQTIPGWSLRRTDIEHGRRMAVTTLGEKVALVSVGWGVSLRLAPLDALPTSTATVIADSGGFMQGPIWLYSRARTAVLLVAGTAPGVDPLRLDADGNVNLIKSQ